MSTNDVCSATSARRGEPLFATGSGVRGWLLIEVRGAWGEDAIHSSALGDHVPQHWKDDLKRRNVRAVAIRSRARDHDGGVRLFACWTRRPGAQPGASLWRRDVASLADVVDVAAELRLDDAPPPQWEEAVDPVLLVCTNGRHDQCCANLGRPLVRSLHDSPWNQHVWECSHIGGDRFAPNLVVLPSSLYFGRVDPDSAPRLLRALDEGRIELSHFRGRTSFSLAEQAVEHFVRQELGVESIDGVIVESQLEDGSFAVRVDERLLRVRVRRRLVSVPEALTCKGRGDQLVPSFTLESITDA